MKQVVQWYTHLGKTFAAATFKGLWDGFFRENKKVCSMLWSVWVFFPFLGKRSSNRIDTVYGRKI